LSSCLLVKNIRAKYTQLKLLMLFAVGVQLRLSHSLRMCGNKVVRRILGPEREVVDRRLKKPT
jgi:hypothetical protein